MPFNADGSYTDEYGNSSGGGGFDLNSALNNISGQLGGNSDPFSNLFGGMGSMPQDYSIGAPQGPMWSPQGVGPGATQSTIYGPGGSQNQQWNWTNGQSNFGMGMIDPSRLSPMERMAGLAQGGIFNGGQSNPFASMQGYGAGQNLGPGAGPGYGVGNSTALPGGGLLTEMPGSYSVNGNPFASQFQQGSNALDYLANLSGGMGNVPQFLQDMFAGRAVGAPTDMNRTLMDIGRMGGMPSPQSMGNLSWSENQFLQGFLESILGIPFADLMSQIGQPFQGLNTARKPRRSYNAP